MSTPPAALITGGSRGLGRALAVALLDGGWRVVVDARDATRLAELPDGVSTVAGDVTDPAHRDRLAAEGPFDLLVNNASALGPSPQPRLADYPPAELERVYAVNTFAPLALIQVVHPPVIVNVSSDAAVEAYEGWGGYGSSKAALDQITAVLAVERPDLRVYSFDPGDMNTDLHQQAFPGEDISDRPAPETVVPALLRLVAGDLPSGRYQVKDLT